MKKRRLFLTLIVTGSLAIAGLTACGSEDTVSESQASSVSTMESSAAQETDDSSEDVEITIEELEEQEDGVAATSINWTQDDTDAMANYMNCGILTLDGTWIYGLSHTSDGAGHLYKEKVDGSEKTQLTDDGGKYITVKDGWVYYVKWGDDGRNPSIKKVRQSGSEETKLVSAKDGYSIDYMFIYNNSIYYTMEKENEDGTYDSSLYRCNLNGKNKERVINRAVFFPYIIGDYIYYQDDEEYSRLYRCELDGSNAVQITEDTVYDYIFDGEYIYYSSYSKTPEYDENNHPVNDNVKQIIKRIGIDGSNPKKIVTSKTDLFVISEDRIIFTNASDSYRLYSCDKTGDDIQNLSQESHIGYLDICGDNLLFATYSDGDFSSVDGVLMCDTDGLNVQNVFSE